MTVFERLEQAEAGSSEGRPEERSDPIAELRRRYATGEIDEAELERRLTALIDTEGLEEDDEAAIEDAVSRLRTADVVQAERE